MAELVRFVVEQSETGVEEVIEQLRILEKSFTTSDLRRLCWRRTRSRRENDDISASM